MIFHFSKKITCFIPLCTVDAGWQVGAQQEQGGGRGSIAAGEMNVNKFVKLCLLLCTQSRLLGIHKCMLSIHTHTRTHIGSNESRLSVSINSLTRIWTLHLTRFAVGFIQFYLENIDYKIHMHTHIGTRQNRIWRCNSVLLLLLLSVYRIALCLPIECDEILIGTACTVDKEQLLLSFFYCLFACFLCYACVQCALMFVTYVHM